MSLSTNIRLFFSKLSGYYIYRKSHLPSGVDLKEDLENKFRIHPKLIFDVGANYGQTADVYAAQFPNAQVYSFEPVAASFQLLQKSTAGNVKIKSYHLAFGESKGEMEITLHNESNSQLNSLKQGLNSTNGNKEKIKIDTIDTFSQEHKVTGIDLLKIDTEGYELEVLKGAVNMLKGHKIQAILCETALSPRNPRNTQLNDLINYLEGYNYFFVGLYETNVNYFKEGLAYSNALFIKNNA